MSVAESEPPRDPLPETEEGSELCTTCGLCCRTLMHRDAVLQKEEIPLARELGLEILETEKDELRFALPCPRLVGDRCGVYARRPGACRVYQCKLLKRLLLGERTLGQSLETVRRARALIASVMRTMDVSEDKRDFWVDLKERLARIPGEGAAARLDAAELVVLLRREFLMEGDQWA